MRIDLWFYHFIFAHSLQVQREVLGTIDICKNELRGVRPSHRCCYRQCTITLPPAFGSSIQRLLAAAEGFFCFQVRFNARTTWNAHVCTVPSLDVDCTPHPRLSKKDLDSMVNTLCGPKVLPSAFPYIFPPLFYVHQRKTSLLYVVFWLFLPASSAQQFGSCNYVSPRPKFLSASRPYS